MPDVSTLEIALNAIIVALYLIFFFSVFFILYHLTRFGVGTHPKRFAAIFFLGAVVLFGVSILLFANLDLGSFFS